MITLIFALIHKILPEVRLAWTDAIIGACVSPLLFTVGERLIALYLGKAGLGSAYGAAWIAGGHPDLGLPLGSTLLLGSRVH
jgi:membrane protein